MEKSNDNLIRLEAAMDSLKRAMRGARDSLGEGLQLTRTQLEILMLLGRGPAQTTGELAGELGLTQSAVTQTVDTLVRRDLLERRSDDRDRRIIHLQLSPAGQDITSRLYTMKHEHLSSLIARLTEAEANAMISATEKFAALLKEKHHNL